uniref:G-type lectin S-receptor-like serine/threonine-protein kinase At4g27290 n=1 Tax=Erigeron canadensis TaxID=72917 RepID=UPI001CB8D6A6|nr:G-type lectin S-receptor-like serine/threonine-protein kinase At4g27290 [Erigeron canadensis]
MLLPLITFLIILTRTYGSLDTIAVNQNISDGKTIISKNAIFELGFFSLGSSNNRYLGIWFAATSPPTIAWVANREHPLNDTSGMVKLDSQGILSIVNGRGTIMWSSNFSASSPNTKPVAQILDTGNLVVRDETNANMENFIWQSFDHPGDTYLQHMKLGKNFITGKETYLTSWKSPDDPSPGDYTFKFLMVKGKYPEVYIMKGSSIETRIGPYNGIAFSGQPNYKPDPAQINDIKMVINQNEMYFAYSPTSTTQFIRMVATPGGKFDIFVLSLPNTEWFQSLTYPIDYCDNFGLCGPYGTCSTATSPNCGCLKGFERSSTDNNTSGCRRWSTELDCGPGEGFLKVSSIKLPDTQNAVELDA